MVNKTDEVILTNVDYAVVVLLFVFIFFCCCNKLPLIEWLKTARIYSLTVLEIRSLKWVSRAAILWIP